ncbi:hypothetical protein L208DRAFT_1415930 [Tricholoma matsutake]|nr:hypothetical protein L208DRAFT_1415930 [Tricholoma matsutake 945]
MDPGSPYDLFNDVERKPIWQFQKTVEWKPRTIWPQDPQKLASGQHSFETEVNS